MGVLFTRTPAVAQEDNPPPPTREEVRARADNLDIAWLRSGDEAAEDALEEPEDIAESIRAHLQRALVEIEGLVGELGNGAALPEAAE